MLSSLSTEEVSLNSRGRSQALLCHPLEQGSAGEDAWRQARAAGEQNLSLSCCYFPRLARKRFEYARLRDSVCMRVR